MTFKIRDLSQQLHKITDIHLQRHTCSIISLNPSIYPHIPKTLEPPTGIMYGLLPLDLWYVMDE